MGSLRLKSEQARVHADGGRSYGSSLHSCIAFHWCSRTEGPKSKLGCTCRSQHRQGRVMVRRSLQGLGEGMLYRLLDTKDDGDLGEDRTTM